jgi:hypothetical protein
MKRIVLFFAEAGVLIPLILFIGTIAELYINVNRVPLSRLLWPYLWPSSIILAATDSSFPNLSLADALILSLAILLNSLVYAIVGLFVAIVWQKKGKKMGSDSIKIEDRQN